MILRRGTAAFTLVELMVATCVACFVGLIAYGVATDALVAFAANFSINRSYGDARRTLDRIGQLMQSAGHVPVLIDATGASTTASPAAGLRFWRYGSNPCYLITTPALTSTTITISLIQPGTAGTIISAPAVNDMITIAAIGFQAMATNVTVSGSSATLSFAGTVASNTSPVITSMPTGTISCLDWTSVAFIDINNQLRYFKMFVPGVTSVSTAANYKVVTNLSPTAPILPFSLGPTPSINVDLYAQAPDYSNLSFKNLNLSTADTYNYFQTAFSSRNATILRSPF